MFALLARSSAEETLDRDGGPILQNPGEFMASDLGAAVLQVLQVRGADPGRNDPNEFAVTVGFVDLDDLD